MSTKRLILSASLSVEQFDHGYWYATEVRSFARSLGIRYVSRLRKDELEDLIQHFLRTGRVEDSSRSTQTTSNAPDSDRPLSSRPRARPSSGRGPRRWRCQFVWHIPHATSDCITMAGSVTFSLPESSANFRLISSRLASR